MLDSLEKKARRAARRAGLRAIKRRQYRGSNGGHGQFMLVEPVAKIPVAGFNYDLSPEDIVRFCGTLCT